MTQGDHLASLDSSQLETLFNNISDHCQRGFPLFSDLIKTSSRLETQIRETSSLLGSYLDSLQKVADWATVSEGSSKDIGLCVSRTIIGQKCLVNHLDSLATTLVDHSHFPLESWKSKLQKLERDHGLKFPKRKKTSGVLGRLRARCSSRNRAEEDGEKEREGELVERRLAVRGVSGEEREHFLSLARYLRAQVIEQKKLSESISDLESARERLQSVCEPMVVTSPAKVTANMVTSPMARLSRPASICSLTSFTSSPDSGTGTGKYKEYSDDCTECSCQVSDNSETSSQSQSHCGQTDVTDTAQSPIYSTVRRSPSPFRGSQHSLRVTSPTAPPSVPHSVPPTVPSTFLPTSNCRPSRSKQTRPPTQRYGSLDRRQGQGGPWGHSLTDSNLFPLPRSLSQQRLQEGEENKGTATLQKLEDKKRKRSRNMTQKISCPASVLSYDSVSAPRNAWEEDIIGETDRTREIEISIERSPSSKCESTKDDSEPDSPLPPLPSSPPPSSPLHPSPPPMPLWDPPTTLWTRKPHQGSFFNIFEPQ